MANAAQSLYAQWVKHEKDHLAYLKDPTHVAKTIADAPKMSTAPQAANLKVREQDPASIPEAAAVQSYRDTDSFLFEGELLKLDREDYFHDAIAEQESVIKILEYHAKNNHIMGGGHV